eukprot:scaffold139209_cov17-Tisochrysis_lutea.AAC.4
MNCRFPACQDQFKKRAGRAAIGSYTSRSQGMIPEWRERMKVHDIQHLESEIIQSPAFKLNSKWATSWDLPAVLQWSAAVVLTAPRFCLHISFGGRTHTHTHTHIQLLLVAQKTADNAHWKQLLSEQADLDSMIKALHEKLKEVFGNTSAYSALALE